MVWMKYSRKKYCLCFVQSPSTRRVWIEIDPSSVLQ